MGLTLKPVLIYSSSEQQECSKIRPDRLLCANLVHFASSNCDGSTHCEFTSPEKQRMCGNSEGKKGGGAQISSLSLEREAWNRCAS